MAASYLYRNSKKKKRMGIGRIVRKGPQRVGEMT